METKIYTPAQFVKEWLTNYNEREKDFFGNIQHVAEIGFTDISFSEALEAFAQAQREECAKNVFLHTKYYDDIRDIMFYSKGILLDIETISDILINKNSILKAPTPQPENKKSNEEK